MATKVMFWNIENFHGDDPARARKVAEHIRAIGPDVVGFSEITDKRALRNILTEELADFDFCVTDGNQRVELMAGWRRGLFDQTLFTQRREFKSENPDLRPGALLSLRRGGGFLNILFLHADSGRKPRDHKHRQDMFLKVWSLRRRLEEVEGAPPKLLVLGDFNTMGQGDRDKDVISGAEEIAALGRDAAKNGMALIGKSHETTWGEVDKAGALVFSSDLDHVLASDPVEMGAGPHGARVTVRGWVDATDGAARREFVETLSDHCSIDCVVAG